jgi:hypothetical protein
MLKHERVFLVIGKISCRDETLGLLLIGEPTRLVPLDGLDVVDEHCLYLCCPYMGELKLCLSVGMASSCRTVKHITPVSASLNKPSAAKQMQVVPGV